MYIKHTNRKELSSQGKSCPKIIGMLIVKDTSALKNGDKVVASSWIVKVKITKNVPNVLLPQLLFSVNSRYSTGSILSRYSIESNVLLQVLFVMCHSRTGLHIQNVTPVNKFE